MMIVMRANATQREVKIVVDRVQSCGAEAHLSEGEERTIIGVVGDVRSIPRDEFLQMPSVDRIIPISRPYKIASREFHPWNSEVPLDGIKLGGPEVIIIAGPCSVESREQLLETAHAVREAGAHVLRGGAYKPRTSPYSFQGMGVEGLEILAEARRANWFGCGYRSDGPRSDRRSSRNTRICSKLVLEICRITTLLHAIGESQISHIAQTRS